MQMQRQRDPPVLLPQLLLRPLLPPLLLQLAWAWVVLGAPQRMTSGRWGWNGWIPPPARG